ncbi:MAG: MATE family efflux transporter, partial [Butyrivibrio sp.]|nr:MATE family efflux transporter [Butyrivibrio sp.]
MSQISKEESENARQERFVYMTQTPIPKLTAQLSVPTIISMLVSGLYNMADTFFVGRISTQATAAVGIVFSLMAIIQAVGFFCGHGSGNYMSRRLGAGDVKEASEMAATGFVLAFILGMGILIVGMIFLHPLSVLLGATPTMMKETQDYMRIILIGAPYMTAQLVVNNQLRFQGSAMYAMVGLVSGAVLNIGLDPLFIFTFGMGVAGAALATILSQLVSFCILFAGSQKGANIRIRIRNARFTKHYLLQIVNGGTPSL